MPKNRRRELLQEQAAADTLINKHTNACDYAYFGLFFIWLDVGEGCIRQENEIQTKNLLSMICPIYHAPHHNARPLIRYGWNAT